MLVYMEGLVQIDKVLQITRESERERQNQKKHIPIWLCSSSTYSITTLVKI